MLESRASGCVAERSSSGVTTWNGKTRRSGFSALPCRGVSLATPRGASARLGLRSRDDMRRRRTMSSGGPAGLRLTDRLRSPGRPDSLDSRRLENAHGPCARVGFLLSRLLAASLICRRRVARRQLPFDRFAKHGESLLVVHRPTRVGSRIGRDLHSPLCARGEVSANVARLDPCSRRVAGVCCDPCRPLATSFTCVTFGAAPAACLAARVSGPFARRHHGR